MADSGCLKLKAGWLRITRQGVDDIADALQLNLLELTGQWWATVVRKTPIHRFTMACCSLCGNGFQVREDDVRHLDVLDELRHQLKLLKGETLKTPDPYVPECGNGVAGCAEATFTEFLDNDCIRQVLSWFRSPAFAS
jgi:hypothetical protein